MSQYGPPRKPESALTNFRRNPARSGGPPHAFGFCFDSSAKEVARFEAQTLIGPGRKRTAKTATSRFAVYSG